MRYHSLLEAVLGKRSNISILRALLEHEKGLTGRQIGELSGLSHRACNMSVNSLVDEGVIKAQRVGKAILYTIASDNVFVASGLIPLLRLEASILEVLKKELADNLDYPGIASVVLFGSITRGEERANSDIDVCVVVDKAKTRDSVLALEDNLQYEIGRAFGNQISFYCLPQADFIDRFKAHDPLIVQIVESGTLVSGKNPKELVSIAKAS